MAIDVDRTVELHRGQSGNAGLVAESTPTDTQGGDSKQWAIGEDITDELVVGSG